MTGYIYKITCLINEKIYIGQTIHTLHKRLYNHGRDAINNGYNYAFAQAIRKHGIENFCIEEIESYTALTWDELKQVLNIAERMYIHQYNSYLKGYNSTLGGDGSLGVHPSEEAKAKTRKALTGRKHTKEATEKTAMAHRQRWAHTIITDEYRDQMRIRGLKGLQSDSWYGNNKKAGEKRRIKVFQYSRDGILISTYDSAVIAQENTGIFASSIYSNCSGKRKSAGGYVWRHDCEG